MYWADSFWSIPGQGNSCVQWSSIQVRLKKKKESELWKFRHFAILLFQTPGGLLGGIPLLGTLFSVTKGSGLLWVHLWPPWGLAGTALAVYVLGSQAWSSGMNLVFILRKFIFDSGRAGRRWLIGRGGKHQSCPHTTTSSPIIKARRWSKAPKSNMPVVFFFFKVQRWL